MKLDKTGQNLIKNFEGLRLKTYTCVGGKLTIGYGHTKGVAIGQVITKEEADKLFLQDIEYFEKEVNSLVQVSITQNQFNALVSFAFNCGITALKDSTLLKMLNAKDYNGAAKQFLRWNKITQNGKLVPCEGLTNRRKAEMEMFKNEC